jgi:hypothetical protein
MDNERDLRRFGSLPSVSELATRAGGEVVDLPY